MAGEVSDAGTRSAGRSDPIDAIRCDGLTKRFAGRAALDGLNLRVGLGEVFGFLGPNGAGKTTTIRLLLGLLRADAGAAYVLGSRVPCPGQLGQVGAMVEEPAFYPWLTGSQSLRVLADTGGPVSPRDIAEALGRAGLTATANRKVKTYSQGMRQRLGLAAALLRRPRLLILDEPTNGLDPAGIREFRLLLRELGDAGTTVFLSSHLLGEIEQVCDRVGILDRGRLVAVGSTEELHLAGDRVRVDLRPEDEAEAMTLLAAYRVNRVAPGRLVVRARCGREVNRRLAEGGVFAESVALERSSLEERFLEITEGAPGRHASAAR
jgi:ABC-2 type transport system ATP-binding protein